MKKLLAVLLVLSVCLSFFAACNGNNATFPNNDNSTPTAPEPTPEPTPEPLYQQPLTGYEKGIDYPYDTSPVCVMVNNIKASNGNDAFPQWGIGSAEVIYEMVTEGGITRLMAVFADYKEMPDVGPVRSARDQHVQLMLPLNALYVHEGASIFAKRMLGESGYNPEDFSMYPWMKKDLYNGNPDIGTRVVNWYTNMNRSQEMCAYTNGELIKNAVDNGADASGEPAPIFNFVSYKEPERTPTGGDANSVYVQFSNSYYGGFDYNAETGEYLKINTKGQPHIDRDTNAQLSFKNVLVLFAPIQTYSSMGYDAGMLVNVDFRYSGHGYYFTNGKYETVRWVKGLPHEPLRITDAGGHEIDIQMNCGRTYVNVTDYSMRDLCTIDGVPFEYPAV